MHMARRNFRQYLRGDRVRTKKYFYVLRPLLAVKWLEQGFGPVPTKFHKLVEAVVDDAGLRHRIEKLIEEKRQGFELHEGPRIGIVSDFIETEIKRIDDSSFALMQEKPDFETLNRLLRDTLSTTWPPAPDPA